MSVFGIPLFFSYENYLLFLNTNFSNLILSTDIIYLSWLLVNFAYLIMVFLVIIPFLYKIFMFIYNHFC